MVFTVIVVILGILTLVAGVFCIAIYVFNECWDTEELVSGVVLVLVAICLLVGAYKSYPPKVETSVSVVTGTVAQTETWTTKKTRTMVINKRPVAQTHTRYHYYHEIILEDGSSMALTSEQLDDLDVDQVFVLDYGGELYDLPLETGKKVTLLLTIERGLEGEEPYFNIVNVEVANVVNKIIE